MVHAGSVGVRGPRPVLFWGPRASSRAGNTKTTQVPTRYRGTFFDSKAIGMCHGSQGTETAGGLQGQDVGFRGGVRTLPGPCLHFSTDACETGFRRFGQSTWQTVASRGPQSGL